jgi:hypothetical protein
MSLTEQERIERRRGYERKYYYNPANRHKDLARNAIADAIRRGKMSRQHCEKCGSEKSEAHHEDYSKRLDVKWLCRPCHKGEHHKTHCIRGHELTPENIYVRPNENKRACRQCRTDHMRNYYLRKRS